MKVISQQLRLSATDLSNHLACHHLSVLDLSVARGARKSPEWKSPDLEIIRQLGMEHELAYLRYLEKLGFKVRELRAMGNEEEAIVETVKLMKQGADIIAQGALAKGRWFGRPDVLRKTPQKSGLGEWSYEVYDCKLALETKGTTILQLSLYTELVAEVQGHFPEWMYVVTPTEQFEPEPYRFAEYAAYCRYIKTRFERLCDAPPDSVKTYPEPVPHCPICRWFAECDKKRRDDDHLSLVAGITRLQQKQLRAWDTDTTRKLAVLPIPLQRRPDFGVPESYIRVREQARVQVAGTDHRKTVHELFIAQDWIPVVLPTLKYATQKHYRYMLDVHLVPVFGKTSLSDIKREWIQTFLATKFSAGLAWKTVKHIRGVLGRTLSSAEEWGYITHNPTLKTKLPRRPIKQCSKAILTPDQFLQVRDRLKEPARSIATVLVLTGLRIGEILALRWKYVDLCRHTLRVAETVYDGHFDTPKSQRSARIVPLAEEACSTLGKLRSSSTRPDDLVFSMDTGQPLDRHNLLRRQLRPTCEKLGLLGITWHSLRHSHATLLDAAGAPLGTVQSLLGHSTSELTREVYLHAIPEDQRRAVANVEALLFGPKRTQIASASQTSA